MPAAGLSPAPAPVAHGGSGTLTAKNLCSVPLLRWSLELPGVRGTATMGLL